MTKKEFLSNLKSPLDNLVWKKFPNGNILQYWAENPQLYSQAFGQKDDLHVFLGGHSGIDIFTKWRDEVKAMHDGTVSWVTTDRISPGGLGVWVRSPELENGEFIETCYVHLDEMKVNIGDVVKQGDVLGYLGNSGFVVSDSTPYWGNAPAGIGAHLHCGGYELIERDGGIYKQSPNPLMGSFDLVPWFTNDFTGAQTLLYNLDKLLRYWKIKYDL